jgi:uncharacterized BrkB/YihY/UPF0761 family membrane protein
VGRLQRNIDTRGRVARGVSGLLCLAVAALLFFAGTDWQPMWLRWVLFGGAVVLGGFQMFEALVGWCITRALGFRTPM